MTPTDTVKKDELIIWTRHILDLLNVSYQVSNHGKEIKFRSKFQNNPNYKGYDIKLYPTTGTYIYHTRTFKAHDQHSHHSIEDNIRSCISYHVNEYAFKGMKDD